MPVLESLDQGTLPWMLNHHIPWLNHVMVVVTRMGDQPFLLVVALAAVAVLAWRRQYCRALVVAGVALAGAALTEIIKQVVGRPRPYVPHALVTIPLSPSFPSGHALNSAAIYVTLALIAASLTTRSWLRGLPLAAGLGLTLLIGASRLYLGVHYLTDVMAGWALGLALALTGFWILGQMTVRRPH
jgi:undecaprenyl-diphosphatase